MKTFFSICSHNGIYCIWQTFTASVAVLCYRVNGDGGNSHRAETVKKSPHGAPGTAAGERQRLVGGSAASVDAGSDMESTSVCESDEDDDDDCSSRLSSRTSEVSDVRCARRRRHRHHHRHRPAIVSQPLFCAVQAVYCFYIKNSSKTRPIILTLSTFRSLSETFIRWRYLIETET